MLPLLILVCGFTLTAGVCELLLKSRKLQSAMRPMALVYSTGLIVLAGSLAAYQLMRPLPVSIFWMGAVFTWFGIRSHVESSILLRMIYLLGPAPMTRQALTSLYSSRYGKAHRVNELLRAGLIAVDHARGTITVTRKGLLISRLALRLQ